jgi:NADP-dependent 3-hydroxy acid dehydrogenase YdfG
MTPDDHPHLTANPASCYLQTYQEFATAGCRHLILIDRDGAGLESTVKLLNVDASRISTHVLDIKDDGAIEELVAEIPVKHGSLDYALYDFSMRLAA